MILKFGALYFGWPNGFLSGKMPILHNLEGRGVYTVITVCSCLAPEIVQTNLIKS